MFPNDTDGICLTNVSIFTFFNIRYTNQNDTLLNNKYNTMALFNQSSVIAIVQISIALCYILGLIYYNKIVAALDKVCLPKTVVKWADCLQSNSYSMYQKCYFMFRNLNSIAFSFVTFLKVHQFLLHLTLPKLFNLIFLGFCLINYNFYRSHKYKYIATISSQFRENGWTIIFTYTGIMLMLYYHTGVFVYIVYSFLFSMIFVFGTARTDMNTMPSIQYVIIGSQIQNITVDLDTGAQFEVQKTRQSESPKKAYYYLFRTRPAIHHQSSIVTNLCHMFWVSLLGFIALWFDLKFENFIAICASLFCACTYMFCGALTDFVYRKLIIAEDVLERKCPITKAYYNDAGEMVRQLERLHVEMEQLCKLTYLFETLVICESIKFLC